MKLTISCLSVFFWANVLAAQNDYLVNFNEYTNDVLVLKNGKVIAGRLYAHTSPDSVLMFPTERDQSETVAKLDISRSLFERVFWKPYGPNLKWAKALADRIKTEATLQYIRQTFILSTGEEYRGEVISEVENDIVLKSCYTQRSTNIRRFSYTKRRNELVFQADLLLDKLPSVPNSTNVLLVKDTLNESPINQEIKSTTVVLDTLPKLSNTRSNGYLGLSYSLAFQNGSFSSGDFGKQFLNVNGKNVLGQATNGGSFGIDAAFMFNQKSVLGVGVTGQFTRNGIQDKIGNLDNSNVSYETNILAMGLAVALPLHPRKVSFLDIRCMGGVAGFSTSAPINVAFGNERTKIEYDQTYGPAFVVDAGLRFRVYKRLELGFRIGHSVAIIDNIQTIWVERSRNLSLDFQKPNKINVSNILFGFSLCVGL